MLKINLSPFRPFRSRNEFVIAAALSMLSFLGAPAWAGTYELVKRSDPRENYQFSDTEGVCEAYEKNLNSFSHIPYGMACGRLLRQDLGFTRPKWKKLDPIQHLSLVKEIELFLKFPPHFGQKIDDDRFLAILKKQIEDGIKLELAQVDIDGDGKPDNLVRFGWERNCDPSDPSTFANPAQLYLLVIDPALSKLEYISRRIQQTKDDVFIYKGKTYSDIFRGYRKQDHYRDASLYIFEFGKSGAAPICRLDFNDQDVVNPSFER